jgi:predicted metal-dependent hydrolase
VGPTPVIAAKILSHHPLAVLLLTLQFEWTTQSHYLETMRNNHDEDLDPRFCDLLKFHWLEEAQHTKLDALLAYELVGRMMACQVEVAVEDYITLVHLLHDALMEQVRLDVKSLERTLRRQFSGTDRQALVEIQKQAYRWGFLCAGLTHPNFLNVLGDKGIQQDVSGNCEHLK